MWVERPQRKGIACALHTGNVYICMPAYAALLICDATMNHVTIKEEHVTNLEECVCDVDDDAAHKHVEGIALLSDSPHREG